MTFLTPQLVSNVRFVHEPENTKFKTGAGSQYLKADHRVSLALPERLLRRHGRRDSETGSRTKTVGAACRRAFRIGNANRLRTTAVANAAAGAASEGLVRSSGSVPTYFARPFNSTATT